MIDPYENNSQSMQIGELIIENQQDKVTIYGDIDIYRNQKGLEQARQLHQLVSKILTRLENEENQLSTMARKEQGKEKQNETFVTKSNKHDAIDNPFL